MYKPIIFMFSGQGSQYYHMGKELYAKNAIFRQWMSKLNDIIYKNIGVSIIDEVYDGAKNKAVQFDRLLYTHPAIFMVEYSLARMLIESGFEPDYVLGASLGEFAAAAVAGVASVEEILQCILKQAELIESQCRRGRMTAVIHNTELYQQSALMSRSSELAAVNYSSHFIISGDHENLLSIEAHLRERDILLQSLPVRYGFHSSNIDMIEDEYKRFLNHFSFHEPEIPMISCLFYDQVTQVHQEHFWNVVRQPIKFQQIIWKLERDNQFSYIDVGPSGTLANFVKKNLNPYSVSQVHEILNLFGQDIRGFEKLKASL